MISRDEGHSERGIEAWERLQAADPAGDRESEAHLAGGASRRIEERARRMADGGGPRLARSPARPRIRRIALFGGTGALALLAAAAILRGADGPPRGDSFSSFAAIAAGQSADGFEHVSWEAHKSHDRLPGWSPRFPDRIEEEWKVELWIGADQRYERGHWSQTVIRGDGVQEFEHLFDREADLHCTGELGGGGLVEVVELRDGQRVRLGRDDSPSCATPPSFLDWGVWEGPALPTDSTELEAALREEARCIVERPRERPQRCDERARPDPEAQRAQREILEALDSDDLEELKPFSPIGFGVAVPLSMHSESDRQEFLLDLGATAGTDYTAPGVRYRPPVDEVVFSMTLGLLGNPLSSPELRAAAFEVLARLDGATLEPDREDRLGRSASLIQYRSAPSERQPGLITTNELYLDPETSQALEIRTIVEPGEDAPPEEQASGIYHRLFEERVQVDSLPPEAAELERTLEEAKVKRAELERRMARSNPD